MKFQKHYNYESGKILKVQFSHTFNRKQYLVLFPDGSKLWTYKITHKESKTVITITIKTQDSVESMPLRDDTRVKEVSLYLFNKYTSKGIDYKLNLHKNKELN